MELQAIILLFQKKKSGLVGIGRLFWGRVATRWPVGSQPSTRRSIFLVQTINLLVARQGNTKRRNENLNIVQMYVLFRIRKFMLRRWQSIDVPICFRWLDKTVEPWRSMTVSLHWTSFYWDTWRFCGMNLARRSTKYTLVFDMSVVIFIIIFIYIY